jgi:predicted deacylase
MSSRVIICTGSAVSLSMRLIDEPVISTILVPAANPDRPVAGHAGHALRALRLRHRRQLQPRLPPRGRRTEKSLAGRLGAAMRRRTSPRSAARRAPPSPAGSRSTLPVLKKTLLAMAIDADIVLDLHCDNEAVLHLYTGTALAGRSRRWRRCSARAPCCCPMPRAASPSTKPAAACGGTWPRTSARNADPAGLRRDHGGAARRDGRALRLCGTGCAGAAAVPGARGPARQPRAAAAARAAVRADAAGGRRAAARAAVGRAGVPEGAGRAGRAGEAVADIVNPVTGATATVRASRDGLLFASTAHRHLLRGMHICKIAGATPFRSGSLLSQ